MNYTNKLNQRGQNIMSTTSDEEEKTEWGSWGDGKVNPNMKDLVELLIKYNNKQKEILEDTRDWLLTNGNQSR